MDDVIHEFAKLVENMDETEISDLLIALVAGFVVNMTESNAEALRMLGWFHLDMVEAVMDDENDDTFH